MYEVALGVGYGLKQLGNLVKELAGLKHADKKIESEVDKLKASFKALQKKHEALEKVQANTGKELELVKRDTEGMKQDIQELQTRAHGLKSQLGKARAQNKRNSEKRHN